MDPPRGSGGPETPFPPLNAGAKTPRQVMKTDVGDCETPVNASNVKKYNISTLYRRLSIRNLVSSLPAAGDGSSSTKVVLPGNENPASRRRRPFQYGSCTTRERKIQPAAGGGRSSTEAVLPENENPAGRRRRPFQYGSCTTRQRKILKLYYQKTKIQPAAGCGRSSTKVALPENEIPADQRTKIQPAAGNGRSSTKVILPDNENPAGRRTRLFQ